MSGSIDKPLFWAVFVLLLAGILVLASSSIVLSQKRFDNGFYYVSRQLFRGVALGLICMFIVSKIDYGKWRRFSVLFLLVSLFLMSLVFLPKLGVSAGGARRWVALGPVIFQPSEFLKLALIVYLASWLEAKRKEVKTFSYGFAPFIVMMSIVSVFLIMQPDIGTLGIIAITSAIIYFLGGGRVDQIAGLAVMGVLLLFLLAQITPYHMNRFRAFFDPSVDPQGISYQINQSFIAIGSGGFWGLGFGQGRQKYNYLPEPMGDSIFAVFAEELGFLGGVGLIGFFLFILWRSLKIAKAAPDAFSRFLAAGIGSSIALQAFVNISAISGLLPLTGIPLPFFSYGSTSLVATMMGVGILMNISRHI
jgi:cell division protein FtsW